MRIIYKNESLNHLLLQTAVFFLSNALVHDATILQCLLEILYTLNEQKFQLGKYFLIDKQSSKCNNSPQNKIIIVLQLLNVWTDYFTKYMMKKALNPQSITNPVYIIPLIHICASNTFSPHFPYLKYQVVQIKLRTRHKRKTYPIKKLKQNDHIWSHMTNNNVKINTLYVFKF